MVTRDSVGNGTRSRESRRPRGVLFLCVRNSARSQIAEGWARALLPVGTRVFSAGSEPAETVHPCAVTVMREVGVEVASQRPKGIGEIPLDQVDLVVTLCSDEVCPVLPGSIQQEHWGLPDPAAVSGGEQEALAAFCATRDEIRRLVEGLRDRWASPGR